jgi:uncharacterized integral membrane protein
MNITETDVPTAAAESVGGKRARHAHRARLYAYAGGAVVLVTILIVLASANTRSVKLSWAVGSTQASLVWIVLATAIVGWLLGITTAVVFRYRTRRPR